MVQNDVVAAITKVLTKVQFLLDRFHRQVRLKKQNKISSGKCFCTAFLPP